MGLRNHRVEGIYNMMESVVWGELERIAQAENSICLCSLCRSDIAAYALNRLPAHYISTHEGEIRFQNLEMDELVHATVLDAMNHVSQHPHRASRTMTEYTVNELFDYVEEMDGHNGVRVKPIKEPV